MITSVRSLPVVQPRNNAPAPGGDVEFSYNPQDSMVMPATTTVVHNLSSEGGSVQTDKVKLQGTLEPRDGKYVYDESNARRWTPANSFASVANTADTFQAYLSQPIHWAFGGDKLGVTPNAGQDLNAFYSRDDGGVFFFYGHDPVTNDTVFTA